jgi:hypothetical protein
LCPRGIGFPQISANQEPSMAVRFNQLVKHGRLAFTPGPAYAFEDPDAEPYFTKMGWAEPTDDAADFTIPLGDIDIDPATVFADGPQKGQRVLGS